MNSLPFDSRKATALFLRDLRTDISYRLSFLIEAANVLVTVASFYFFSTTLSGHLSGSYQPFPFLLLGLAVNSYLITALYCFAQGIRGSHSPGLIKAVLGAPISPGEFLLYSSLYPVFRAGLDGMLYLAGGVMLGLRLERINFVAVALFFALAVAAHAGIGMVSAAFTVLFKKGDPLIWLMGGLSWLMGGVFYLLDVLPLWMQRVAAILPLSHALKGTRAAVLDGASISQLIPEIGALGLFSLVSLPVGVTVFRAAVRRARETGALGHS